MSHLSITTENFISRLPKIEDALSSKDKWVRDDLSVRKKENGFLRFLKVIILPFAMMFGKDPFGHVRINAIARVLFEVFKEHEISLSLEDKSHVFRILLNLNERKRNSSQIQTYLKMIGKCMFSLLAPPPTEANGILPLPVEEEEDTPSAKIEGEQHNKKKAPPTLPDYFLSKSSSGVGDRVLTANTAVGAGNFTKELEAFIESLEATNGGHAEIQIQDDDILFAIENHKVWGPYCGQFKELASKEEKMKWLEENTVYLSKKLEEHKAANRKNIPSRQKACMQIRAQEAYIDRVNAENKAADLKNEQDKLLKEVSFDPATITGTVKKNMWKILLMQGSLENFEEEQAAIVDWINKGEDLTNPDMKRRHGSLAKIISSFH